MIRERSKPNTAPQISNPHSHNPHPNHRHLETSIQQQQFRASPPPYGGRWGNRRGGLFAPTASAALAARHRAQGRGPFLPSDDEDDEEEEDGGEGEGDVLAAHSLTLEGLRRRGDYCEEMAYDSELDGSD